MATQVATTQIPQSPPVIPVEVNRPAKRDVWTTLNYYRDPGDGSPPTPVYVGGNTVTNERPIAPTNVLVRDITKDEDNYTLDSHGFQLVHDETGFDGFDDDGRIKAEYYAECEELYKKITQAAKVHIFGHLVRRGPSHWHALGAGNALKKGPLHRVHVDQSYQGAELVLRKNFPDLAASLLLPETAAPNLRPKRWAIINLWRPLSTIYKDPLAVACAHSIPDADLVDAQIIYTKQAPPFDVNRTWSLRPSTSHHWYYKNEMRPEEVLMIKCFDSVSVSHTGMRRVARRTPHCAFVDEERSGEEWADRESVEVRAVVVWDP